MAKCKDKELRDNKYEWNSVPLSFYSDNFGFNEEKDPCNQYGFCLEYEAYSDVDDKIKLKFLHLPKGVKSIVADIRLSDGAGTINDEILNAYFGIAGAYDVYFIFSAQKYGIFTMTIDITNVTTSMGGLSPVEWSNHQIYD